MQSNVQLAESSPAPATPTAADLDRAVTHVLCAQARLARRPLERVLDPLAAAVESWLASDSPWRARAEALLPAATGFSIEMIRHGLPLLLAPLRGDAVRALLVDELGDLSRLDAAAGPRLVAHVLPGNIPGLAANAVCLTLAAKAAALIKPGVGDRLFPLLFADSLRAVDPDLADCVAVRYWRGGDTELEHAALARADVVEAAGSDAAIAALRARVPRRFIGHGSKISCAFIGAEVAADRGALEDASRAVAADVSIWDQRGCLSPQVIFAECERPAALDVIAAALADALAAAAVALPRRQLTLEEQAAILRFRHAAEWDAVAGGARGLIAGADLAWTVVIESEPALRPTCLQRTIRVQPVARLHEAIAARALSGSLEGVGLAVAPERFRAAADAFTAAGARRVCSAGQMQRPTLEWKSGGHARVAEWFAA